MRNGTLVVTMVSASAIPAGPHVWAIAAIMSQVFAMAFEAVWVEREAFLPFAQQ